MSESKKISLSVIAVGLGVIAFLSLGNQVLLILEIKNIIEIQMASYGLIERLMKVKKIIHIIKQKMELYGRMNIDMI